jgi:hypothetical protein
MFFATSCFAESGKACQLMRIDEQRIHKKAETLSQYLSARDMRRWITLGVLGGASVGALAATGIWYFSDNVHDGARADCAGNSGMNNISHAEFDYWHYRFQQEVSVKYSVQKAFALVIQTFVASILVSLSSKIWESLKKRTVVLFTGDTQDLFSQKALSLIKELATNSYSIKGLAYDAAHTAPDDTLFNELKNHMANNVVVDHVALVHAIEEFFAFVLALSEYDSTVLAEQKVAIADEIRNLCVLSNKIIDEKERVVYSLCHDTQNAQNAMHSLLQVIQGLSNELDHFVRAIGSLLYKESFQLQQHDA